jgi:hypothetical protein
MAEGIVGLDILGFPQANVFFHLNQGFAGTLKEDNHRIQANTALRNGDILVVFPVEFLFQGNDDSV